ncbi:MAG: PD-(D/E)XK nuclease family transposase [Moraxellaceae bacterium]|nr:PD-(D/E)XK nuclease family transposase [Moraxellaceae bacterium]
MNLPQQAKYINPFTDYGFKRIFGEEPNKDLLKDFLNELLREEQGEIKEIQYLNGEQLGNTIVDRKAIFDIYCTNEKGEKFIVELQKAKQDFFKERSIFYSTFPIQEQGKKGSDWNFNLKAVYTIGILDFTFDEDKNNPNYVNKYRYDVKLTEQQTKDVFYDKLTFIYLAMPKFNKKIDELETHFDKWLYIFKNLSEMQEVPNNLQEDVFNKLFQTAEIAQFTHDEMMRYENSLKYYRDMKNSLDTAKHERSIEIAKSMKVDNLPIATIIKYTGLIADEINQL